MKENNKIFNSDNQKKQIKYFYCPFCGKQLTGSFVYCPFCGKQLTDDNSPFDKLQSTCQISSTQLTKAESTPCKADVFFASKKEKDNHKLLQILTPLLLLILVAINLTPLFVKFFQYFTELGDSKIDIISYSGIGFFKDFFSESFTIDEMFEKYRIAIIILMFIPALLALACIYGICKFILYLGSYSKTFRKSTAFYAVFFSIVSLIGVIILFYIKQDLQKEMMGLEIGTFGIYPYVLFGLNVVLTIIAFWLVSKNVSEQAANTTVWEKWGILENYKKFKTCVQKHKILSPLIIILAPSLLSLIIFFFAPVIVYDSTNVEGTVPIEFSHTSFELLFSSRQKLFSGYGKRVLSDVNIFYVILFGTIFAGIIITVLGCIIYFFSFKNKKASEVLKIIFSVSSFLIWGVIIIFGTTLFIDMNPYEMIRSSNSLLQPMPFPNDEKLFNQCCPAPNAAIIVLAFICALYFISFFCYLKLFYVKKKNESNLFFKI